MLADTKLRERPSDHDFAVRIGVPAIDDGATELVHSLELRFEFNVIFDMKCARPDPYYRQPLSGGRNGPGKRRPLRQCPTDFSGTASTQDTREGWHCNGCLRNHPQQIATTAIRWH